MDAVGVIGLGLMGAELANRLRAAGFPVVGYDVRAECREKLGEHAVDSVREVVEKTQVILLSLPTSDIVAEVVEQAGDTPRGTRIIDTTTGDPDATASLGERLARIGIGYLDATLTGSSAVARAGELVVTAGGTAEDFSLAEPLFRTFAKQWFHVGPAGSGARAKLVVNLVLGLNRAVLAEGLAFARRSGLDPTTLLAILKSGAAYSRAMDSKGPKMIDGDFAPEARLAQHLKDVRLILATGVDNGSILPLSELHERLLSGIVAAGFGDEDNSAIIRAFGGAGGMT